MILVTLMITALLIYDLLRISHMEPFLDPWTIIVLDGIETGFYMLELAKEIPKLDLKFSLALSMAKQ
jgi:hypothetical protein